MLHLKKHNTTIEIIQITLQKMNIKNYILTIVYFYPEYNKYERVQISYDAIRMRRTSPQEHFRTFKCIFLRKKS